ncbi:MAG: PEP-CTERM sorting domain-containing protein, partial [Cyanobacteria bacterium P01_A01_bin.84]
TGTGQIINGAGLFEKDGLRLSTKEGTNPLLLFNSDCKGKTGSRACTGGDDDLATGASYGTQNQGNVLIIQENISKNKNQTNNIYNPDDKVKGTFVFDFTDSEGVLFESISLLDLDESHRPKFTLKYVDGTRRLFQYKNNKWKTKSFGDSSQNDFKSWRRLTNDHDGNSDFAVTLDNKEVNGKLYKGDNSLRTYNFNKFNAQVAKMEMWLPGSGAVTGLEYKRAKRKVPEPLGAIGLGLATSVILAKKRRRKSNSQV